MMIFFISLGEGLTTPAIPLLGKSRGAGNGEIGILMTVYGLARAVEGASHGILWPVSETALADNVCKVMPQGPWSFFNRLWTRRYHRHDNRRSCDVKRVFY